MSGDARRMAPTPAPWTGIVRITAGCRECFGDAAAWSSHDGRAELQAQLHHVVHGHETWCEKTVLMAWGRRDDD